MFCVIIKKDKEGSKVVYKSSNFYESVYKLEEFAYETIFTNNGIQSGMLICKKIPNEKGVFGISTLNKIRVIKKNKTGWIINATIEEICEFELIYSRSPRGLVVRSARLYDENERDRFTMCLDEILKTVVPFEL